MHKLPKNFKDLLEKTPKAKETWENITPLARNEWICFTTSAKKVDTNDRRLKISISQLSSGKRRPCCWAGCMHR